MADTVSVTIFHARTGDTLSRHTTLRGDAEKHCPGGSIDGYRILRVTWSADRNSVSIDVS